MILDRNHHEARCPFGGPCNENCAALQSDDEGTFVCSIALLPMSDTFGPQTMRKESPRKSQDMPTAVGLTDAQIHALMQEVIGDGPYTAPGGRDVPMEDVVPEMRDEGPYEGDGGQGPVGLPGLHPMRRPARNKAEADEEGYEVDVEFIGQSVQYIGGYGGAETIESAARTCTQSHGIGRAKEFVQGLLRRGHMSPFEFGCADFLLEVDRAIQQEYTRHRHFGFNIESTRWIDYRKKPTMRFVTKPPRGMVVPDEAIKLMEDWCELCALVYETELALGAPKDYARKALVLALASNMRMIGNLRAWLEMIPKRLNPAAHAEAREVAGMLLASLVKNFAGVFDHIEETADEK